MTIEQIDKIDLIGINKEQGYVALTISDHLEWDEKNLKLQTLQDKINAYLMYIESGQIYETYPNAKGKQVQIELCCLYEPNEEGVKFLSLITPIIEDAGFKFIWEVKSYE